VTRLSFASISDILQKAFYDLDQVTVT